MALERLIFASDWHIPVMDAEAFACFKRILSAKAFNKPNYLVFGGDVFDFDSLSPKYLPDRLRGGDTVRDAVLGARRLFESVLNISKPKSAIWLDGNHEDRPFKYMMSKAPSAAGMYDLHHDLLKLHQLGFDAVVKYEEGNGRFHVGNKYEGLSCVHGWLGSGRTAGATAKAHALALDVSVMHGHAHVCESVAFPTPNRTLWGCAAGGLFDLSRLKKKYVPWPVWRNGFGYAEIDGGVVRRVVAVPFIRSAGGKYAASFDGRLY